MEILEDGFSHDRILVFEVSGSRDVVGSIPTVRLLESHDIKVILGGVI